MLAASLSSCGGSDAIMHPEKVLQRGSRAADKGNIEKAVSLYDSVIDAYCECGDAYALRAAATSSAKDIVRSFTDGVSETNVSILRQLAPGMTEDIAGEFKTECMTWQSPAVMYGLGETYENSGRIKDAYNAYRVAAMLDANYFKDEARTSSAAEEEGRTDYEYFSRIMPDGSEYFNLRATDPYWGNDAAATSARKAETAAQARAMSSQVNSPLKPGSYYPELARKRGIQGTVTARVSVAPDGQIKNVRIMEGVHFTLDSETVKLIRSTDWRSACQGKSVTFVVPVAWKL